MKLSFVALLAALATAPAVLAQGARQQAAIASADIMSQISMFNYHAGPKSDLNFRGTPIAANGRGKVQVEYQDGNAQISAKVEDLPEPSSLGPYTTYVLWALTPDGRAQNQGVLATGTKGELKTTYSASQFALIVTAEPHFAVVAPSTMLVLYNVADKVKGEESKVTTLVERADYSKLAAIANTDEKPVEVIQAQYAVALAGAAGAERFASQAYASATQQLAAAETALKGKRADRKTATDSARGAVVAGEDARRAAMVGAADAAVAAERKAAADAAAAAREAAEATAAAAGAEEGARIAAQKAREDLRNRLNAALPTRETERGLVSEVGGVQFATGTAELNSSAREGLARFAGVVASYPSLRFNVEGHTDNTGTLATNNELSHRRAIAVRDYLISQGIGASRIDTQGLGPSQPIADNETAEGRARNRRVEIVLSAEQLARL